HVGMLAAKILKILARDEQKLCIFRRRGRCRVVSAVKHRKFGKRASRPFNRQHLFASRRRQLEDARLHPTRPGTIPYKGRLPRRAGRLAAAASCSFFEPTPWFPLP